MSPTRELRERFHPNDPVRLTNRHGEHPEGARGRILGRFQRAPHTWLVSFDGASESVEVGGDEIVAAA